MNIRAFILSTALISAFAVPAFADSSDYLAKERFQLRVRALGVLPQEKSTVNIGGDAKVSNAITPEIDVSYFFTPTISAELIAATTRHNLSHSSGASLGQTWVLPPVLTVQYHFMKETNFQPYIGAGINYSIFYNENSANGFTNLDLDNSLGPVAQAGFDYWIDKNWGLNFDVKKVWLNTEASLNDGAVQADVDIDPWLVGAGISYRF